MTVFPWPLRNLFQKFSPPNSTPDRDGAMRLKALNNVEKYSTRLIGELGPLQTWFARKELVLSINPRFEQLSRPAGEIMFQI